MNSVAGKVELVGLTVAREPQPHYIVTNNIVTHKGSAVTEATNLAQSYAGQGFPQQGNLRFFRPFNFLKLVHLDLNLPILFL